MKKISLLTYLVVAVLFHSSLSYGASPQTSRVMDGPGRIREIPWEQFDNKLVEVEGLAWGAFDKGLGAHLKLAQNDEVYLENLNLTNADLDGRLLNIVGIFRKKRVEKAPPGTQGYGESFDYYTIEVIAARKIEKVEQYQVLPPRGEWLVPGMPIAEALQKVKARKLATLRSTPVKAQGVTAMHSFQVNESRTLSLGESQGRITHVWEHPQDAPQEVYKPWNLLRGYDLSTLKAAEIPIPSQKTDQFAIPPGGSFR